MARKTKEEALATRARILDAAELVFEQRGVSRTSLDEVAKAAALTRGAIYWHFRDKADLFNAMMERATLPLEADGGAGGIMSADTSLDQLRECLLGVLRRVVADPQMKRVFEIARHKVEYVDEMRAVRTRRIAVRDEWLAGIERAVARAVARGELGAGTPSREAALGLQSMLEGLLQNWMLDEAGFDLVGVGGQVFDTYLAGLALALRRAPPS